MSDPNLSSFIWSVADLLRGDYKQPEYGKVILPFTVLRRLDCVLEPTKPAVLAELATRQAAGLNPENVPLAEDIAAYFAREVLPHAPDAWIDHDKTKVGYEIPFNRHFYVFKPPRSLAEIDADLHVVTDRILGMIAELTQ